MYPIKLGFEEARKRVAALKKNGHHAEALITSVFTLEKTLRRSLRYCALSRGFTSKQCNQLFERMGFQQMKDVWPCFERDHRTLPNFIGPSWEHVPTAVSMRNKLAHGERVYELSICNSYSRHVMTAVTDFREATLREYGFDSWQKMPTKRKPSLQWIDNFASGKSASIPVI